MLPAVSLGQAFFIRIFRAWSAARATGDIPLAFIQSGATPFGATPELAVACDSLFSLTTAHLGRELIPQCCCSTALSSDEAALLGILHYAPFAGAQVTSASIPHGLPGAILWAASAVLRSLRETLQVRFSVDAPLDPDGPRRCPFAPGHNQNVIAIHGT